MSCHKLCLPARPRSFRNMATTAGNLLQKTRCMYYRDIAYGCNKRQPGTGCSAIDAARIRMLAILGTSDKCIASNPSDQNVALVGPGSGNPYHRTQGRTLRSDLQVLPIAAREAPRSVKRSLSPASWSLQSHSPPVPTGAKSLYLKLRDRASYEFALASAAIVVKRQGYSYRSCARRAGRCWFSAVAQP